MRDFNGVHSSDYVDGETPTEVGRCLREVIAALPVGVMVEKPPPEWGGVCEARWGDQLEQAIERKTPAEAGRCLRGQWPSTGHRRP